MAIYRGAGGAGDATNDATVTQVQTYATQAAASATAAESSATAASSSASGASSSASSASTSASNASTSASQASASASAAATSASEAAGSATDSYDSSLSSASYAAAASGAATTAASYASNSAVSATNAETYYLAALAAKENADTFATNAELAEAGALAAQAAAEDAQTAAENAEVNAASSASGALVNAQAALVSEEAAAESATSAANSATSAASSATAAAASATAASTSETNAATSESNAATSASAASTFAANALASETAAASSATNAAASETNASTSESNAATSATAAAASAVSSANSATAAASSASTAESARDDALAALDSFDDRYLGVKSSAPTLDNDGNALLTGALYYNSTTSQLYIWDGAAWDPAAFSVSSAVTSFNTRTGAVTLTSADVTNALTYTPLNPANNLSDVASAATARTNLGLGTAATSNTGDFVASSGASPTFVNVTATGDVQIDGDLTVNGTTTTINAENLAVADNMIYLNDGSTTANPDLGFAGNYNDGTYAHAGLFRDASDGRWKFYDSYTPEPDASAFIDTSHASFALADLQIDTVIANTYSGGNVSNWDTAYSWGNHASAGYQAAATAVTTSTNFGGDVSGTYNNIVVADDSHNHVISNVDGLQTILDNKQPLDADLTAIAGLAGTSGFLTKTAADTWSLDTNTYLTGNQLITLTGDVSGSGTTSISVTVADDSHNHIISNVDGLQAALDEKAPIVSPAFTGVPTAATAAVGTNTTQIATTAFVNAEIANDAPTKTGGGASGTWGISITGNAATATSATTATSAGSATNATYANASSDIFYPAPRNSTTTDSNSSIEVRNVSGTGDSAVAAIALHCQGSYASKMYLRADGYVGWGGWSAGSWRMYCNLGTGDFTASGNVTAYSDPRLKENIVPIANALDLVEKLDGVHFTWKHGIKHNEGKEGKSDVGVLADQVEAIFPELVSSSVPIDGESYRTVAYDKLVPLLIEAIKELRKEVNELKAK